MGTRMRRPRAVREQEQRERTAREDGDLTGAELERLEEEVDVEAELVPGRSWCGPRTEWRGLAGRMLGTAVGHDATEEAGGRRRRSPGEERTRGGGRP